MNFIDRGWQAYRGMLVAPGTPESQVEELRQAYFSGAAVLFSTIMNVMDPGTEPTEKDLNVMDVVHRELQEFARQVDARLGIPAGMARGGRG